MNTYKTKDLDFASLLVSQSELFEVQQTVEDGVEKFVAKRIDPPGVEICDLVPYRDSNAREDAKSTKYEFILRSRMNETPEQFHTRMSGIARLLLNRRLLVEPISFMAWKRHFRSWMLETDEGRRRLMAKVDPTRGATNARVR